MLYKSRGIALSFIKYKESSIIARIFTETFGMQSYIVNGVRSKKARTKIALFQPLTMLDLVVYHNKKSDINRISEIKCSYSFKTIPFEIKKTAIALFLTEFLNQVLREEGENEPLFRFVSDSVMVFDTQIMHYENFHLRFLLKLTKYLGINPESARSMLQETGHAKAFEDPFTEIMDSFIKSGYGKPVRLGKSTRSEILMATLDYFRFHYDSIKEIKSVQVLKEVLS